MSILNEFQITPEETKELSEKLQKYLFCMSLSHGLFDKWTEEEMREKVRDFEDRFLVYPGTDNYNHENVLIAAFAFGEYVLNTEYIMIKFPWFDGGAEE